jgi:hypothetical protein
VISIWVAVEEDLVPPGTSCVNMDLLKILVILILLPLEVQVAVVGTNVLPQDNPG